jgi:hypothetical protein
MCVKSLASELENYFLSILKEPPSGCTQSTSVSHHHPLGYNICHYLTAGNKLTQRARKYLHSGIQFLFFHFQGIITPHILLGVHDK